MCRYFHLKWWIICTSASTIVSIGWSMLHFEHSHMLTVWKTGNLPVHYQTIFTNVISQLQGFRALQTTKEIEQWHAFCQRISNQTVQSMFVGPTQMQTSNISSWLTGSYKLSIDWYPDLQLFSPLKVCFCAPCVYSHIHFKTWSGPLRGLKALFLYRHSKFNSVPHGRRSAPIRPSLVIPYFAQASTK